MVTFDASLGPFPTLSTELVFDDQGISGQVGIDNDSCQGPQQSPCMTSYAAGSLVTLEAEVGNNSKFDGFSGDCVSLSATCQFTIVEDSLVTATFSSSNGQSFSLTAGKLGEGDGTITSDPPGINCGSDCSQSYPSGTQVTLTATPTTDSTFEGWSGACQGMGSCVITMNAEKAVTATFEQSSQGFVTFTLTKSGTGSGRVSSDPPGIDCGSDCSESYPSGTEVNFTVTPDAGSFFEGWGGDEDCAAFMVLDFDTNCTVIFTQGTSPTNFTLTVEKAGTGSGAVASSPMGIDCGSDCSQSYPSGTQVTLTATPTTDSTFEGWSGACQGMGSCVITMNAEKAVTATFEQSSQGFVTFTLTKSGTGSGRVSSDPPGIDCGSDCSESYPSGTEVNFTVTPDAGSFFEGWGGGEDCAAFMVLDFDTNCTVIFTQGTSPTNFTLTVEKAGTGSGAVASSPMGIDCGSDCSESYPRGIQLTLTATPATDSTFEGWSGACQGTGPCVVAMEADKAVTATFSQTAQTTFTLTVARVGSGSGTVTSSPAGIDCGEDCSQAFPRDTEVSLSPSPGPGSLFSGWGGDDDCLDGIVTLTAESVCVGQFDSLADVTAYLPQVANGQFSGGSIRTTFILFNTNAFQVEVTLRLTDDDGGPFETTIAELGTGHEFQLKLNGGETRIFDTDGRGSLVAGAAVVTAANPIGVSSIFSIFDLDGKFVTEAGVGSSPVLTDFVFPADSTGLFNTGIAVFNPEAETTSLTFRLLDTSGQQQA